MIKAIKVTEVLKNDNFTFFKNDKINTIVRKKVPSSFRKKGNVVFGYDQREDLQHLDGWGEIIEPDFDFETQYRGHLIEHTKTPLTYIYEIIDYTEEELKNKEIVPQTITSSQGMIILHRLGKLSAIENIIETMDIETKILWNKATVWNINNPVIIQISNVFDFDLNKLFLEASKI
jgi:hypothetical protein